MIPAWASYWLGKQRRQAGHYDALTLSCLREAWRRQPSLRNLLSYLGIRRDLGYPPSPGLLSALIARLPDASGHALHRALNLLLEGGMNPAQLAGIDPTVLQSLAAHSPPLAGALEERSSPAMFAMPEQIAPARRSYNDKRDAPAGATCSRDNQSSLTPLIALAHLQNRQAAWRQEFADWLAERRGSICVVGNAPTLTRTGHGSRIDANRCVVRFNRFQLPAGESSPRNHQSAHSPGWTHWLTRACCHPGVQPSFHHSLTTPAQDTGSRIDVLVCAPDLAGTLPGQSCPAEWLILSGCDVRYQLYDWQSLVPLLDAGQKILTVPRKPWRRLVRELHAPPSAGVLLLEWLIELVGDVKGITAADFQDDRQPAQFSRHYHHALPWQRAGRRHNWSRELALLQRWRADGLTGPEAS